MNTDEKKPPVGGMDNLTTEGADQELLNVLRSLVGAAADFKYWIDIQPVGKAFHPGGGDVRDVPAYKSACQALAGAQALLNDVKRTHSPN